MSSRFFRTADSSTSSSGSESESGSESDCNEGTDANTSDLLPQSSVSATSATARHSNASSQHRDALLHALLEERCLNEVLATYNHLPLNRRPNANSSDVRTAATTKYQRLCTQLASYDLISTGLEGVEHANLRQTYRDGLDMLGRQRPAAATVPPPLRRLLTDSDAIVGRQASSTLGPQNGMFNQAAVPFPLRKLLTDAREPFNEARTNLVPVPGNSVAVSPSRSIYHNTFEELGILGRGGYGVVYRARHRLDDQVYAVKKVPLNPKMHEDINEVLLELRTMAQLEHPNIVRYHNSWVEEVDCLPSHNGNHRTMSGQDLSVSTDAVGGAEDSWSAAGPVSEALDGIHVDFENSLPVDTCVKSFEDSFHSHDELPLQKIWTHASTADESIARFENDGSASNASSLAGPLSGPAFALHMQMSLHPMTLADFLSPTSAPAHVKSEAPPLKHCFHLSPSISILLAILEGLEYLHDKGIAHRDIKPANIFMGRHNNPGATRGSVDLWLCSECRSRGHPNPMRLEVRIGDFGLVGRLADSDSLSNKADGTQLYRPPLAKDDGRSLDIYALGIVAFELLCPFHTRSERVHTLQGLKRGELPQHSNAHAKSGKTIKVMECIAAMLSQSVSILELKEQLQALLHE